MPTTKLRNLGQYGILADPRPFDLPPTAFSAGSNVRFLDGCVSRGPVFRTAGALAKAMPRAVASYENLGSIALYVSYQDGTITKWTDSSEADVSIASYTPVTSDAQITNCTLSSVLYQNRSDRVPWALLPTASAFTPLANWDATWRCNVLRAFNSALIALNVTKGASSYPNMVKTSDFALSGAVPASWDAADPTTNAYENVLAEMKGSITDGLQLGSSAFYIYSNTETWEMLPTGDTQIYEVRRKFNDAGAISANCTVEVDGKHFVFGASDLWVHDGTGKRSIASGKVRRFVFKSLAAHKAANCFVAHNPNLKEIHFCFVSGDRLVHFNDPSFEGCNRSAVYNYVQDTWSFDDLPRVFGADMCRQASSLTWAADTATWDTAGGSWQSLDDSFTLGLFFVGGLATGLTATMYAHDLYGDGSLFTYPLSTAPNPPALLERDGIDLDEVNADLTGYKVVRTVWPECVLDPTGSTIDFQFGSSDAFNQPAVFGDWQTYDGATLNRCDFMAAGRYLYMKARYNDYKSFALSGLDLDLIVTGER